MALACRRSIPALGCGRNAQGGLSGLCQLLGERLGGAPDGSPPARRATLIDPVIDSTGIQAPQPYRRHIRSAADESIGPCVLRRMTHQVALLQLRRGWNPTPARHTFELGESTES